MLVHQKCLESNYPPDAQKKDELSKPDFVFKFVDTGLETVCSLEVWCNNMPEFEGEKIAFLGNYSAKSQAHGMELLGMVEEHLKLQGHTFMIGPVNGNTWSKYRLVTEGFGSEPFALENYTERELPKHFVDAGFKSIAQYHSSILEAKKDFCGKREELQKHFANLKVTVRNFDKSKADTELEKMWEISMESFKNNYLYTPIEKDEFLYLYRPIVSSIDEDLVLIAEDGDKPVAFVFALPNKILAKGRDDTIVLKTLARIPRKKYKGLGLYLVDLCHLKAYQKGYGRVIHALYKNDNRSMSFSDSDEVEVIRKYELFGKRI